MLALVSCQLHQSRRISGRRPVARPAPSAAGQGLLGRFSTTQGLATGTGSLLLRSLYADSRPTEAALSNFHPVVSEVIQQPVDPLYVVNELPEVGQDDTLGQIRDNLGMPYLVSGDSAEVKHLSDENL